MHAIGAALRIDSRTSSPHWRIRRNHCRAMDLSSTGSPVNHASMSGSRREVLETVKISCRALKPRKSMGNAMSSASAHCFFIS